MGELIFEDLNNDGVIDSNDQYRYDANAFPKSQFGLNFGFNYKDFDLSVLFQGQSGAKWRMDNGFDSGAGGNGLAYVANNSYMLDDPNAELPRVRPTGIGASDNDFWYHDVFFARLKSFEFGYNLPNDVMSNS